MATTLYRGASKSLNSLIVEYFDHLGFDDLTTKFLAECTVKGDPLPYKKSRILDSPLAIWEKLRVPFEAGAMEPFFQIWVAILGFWRKKILLDPKEVSELLFKLHVYFATFPIRCQLPDAEKKEAMRRFKVFLDERKVEGYGLDQEAPWILPCYALPFVQAPENHVSFRVFFEDGWVDQLVGEIKEFWTNLLPTGIPRSEPKLLAIFKWHQHSRMKRQLTPSPGSSALSPVSASSSHHSMSGGNSSAKIPERTAELLVPPDVIASMAIKDHTAAAENSSKIVALRTRRRMVETDLWRTTVEHWRDKKRFNQLLALAVELSRAARDMHRGEPVNVHLTLSNCVSIMPEIFSTELREKRSVLRLEKTQQLKVDPMVMIHEALTGIPLFTLAGEEYEVQKMLSPSNSRLFDYQSLKLRLMSDTPLKRALLFQALRWKVTKETHAKARELFVNELVEHDFLSLDGAQATSSLRESALWDYCGKNVPKILEQSQIRMLCTLSAFPDGRNYLCEVEPLIVGLSKKLASFTGTTNDDFTVRDLGVATLQKLSLRRRATDVMLREEILEWLLILLDRARLLETYVIEYSTALLMNLCMRQEGKRRFALNAVHGLRVLMSLMSLEKEKADKIFLYIHGTLNAVLDHSSVLYDAQTLQLEAHLRGFRSVFSEWGRNDLRLQADIILRRLYSSAPLIDQIRPAAEEEDEEECSDYESVDDETRVQCLEDELDESDPVKGDLCVLRGADLLNEFVIAHKTTNNMRAPDVKKTQSRTEIPARPMTPRGVLVKPVDFAFIADEEFSDESLKHGSKPLFLASRKEQAITSGVPDPPPLLVSSLSARKLSSATVSLNAAGSRRSQNSAGHGEAGRSNTKARPGRTGTSKMLPNVASAISNEVDEAGSSDGCALVRKPNQMNAWRTISTATKIITADDRPPSTKMRNLGDRRWSGSSTKSSNQGGSLPASPGLPKKGAVNNAAGVQRNGGGGRIAPLPTTTRKSANNVDYLSASDPGALTYTKQGDPSRWKTKRAASPTVPVMPCSPVKQAKDRTKIPSPVSPAAATKPNLQRELSVLHRNLPKKNSVGIQPIRRPPSRLEAKKDGLVGSPESSPSAGQHSKNNKSPPVLPRIPLKSATANGRSDDAAAARVGCRKAASSATGPNRVASFGPKASPNLKDGKDLTKKAHFPALGDDSLEKKQPSTPGGDENGCGGVPHYSLAGLRGFDPKDYQVAFGSKPKIPRTPPGSVTDLRQDTTESESFGNDESSDNNDVVMGSLRATTTDSQFSSDASSEPSGMMIDTNSGLSPATKGFR